MMAPLKYKDSGNMATGKFIDLLCKNDEQLRNISEEAFSQLPPLNDFVEKDENVYLSEQYLIPSVGVYYPFKYGIVAKLANDPDLFEAICNEYTKIYKNSLGRKPSDLIFERRAEEALPHIERMIDAAIAKAQPDLHWTPPFKLFSEIKNNRTIG